MENKKNYNWVVTAKWFEIAREALKELGGKSHRKYIFDKVREMVAISGRKIIPSLEMTVQNAMESNSSDSDNWTKVRDIFCQPDGKGTGVWALRNYQ